MRASYHFTGRSEELKKLEDLLLRDPSDRKICAIFGSAGFGKSALAYHFAESQKEKFADGVLGLRVDGKDVDTIARDFARIYGIKIDSEDERDATTIMKESFSHRNILLIFDNVDEKEIDSLLNLGNNCSIILTTRDRGLPGLLRIPQDHRIELLPLPDQDSQDFFEKLIGKERFDNEKESAYNIIKFVGNVPLALRIIGAILETQDWLPLLDFERSLSEEKTRLSKLQISKDKDLNVQASIALSLKYLKEEEIKFFACLSVCPESGFSTCSAIAASGYDEFPVNDHLGSLRRLCLLDRTDIKKLVFHPLVLLFAKDLATKSGILDDAAERHALYYIDQLKNNVNISTTSDISENIDDIVLAAKWISHQKENDYEFILRLFSIFNHLGIWKRAEDLISIFIQKAETLENWSYAIQLRFQQTKYLSMGGELYKAEETLNLIPEILDRIQGQEIHQHLEISYLNTLGTIIKKRGRLTEAEEIFRRCIEIAEKRDDEKTQSFVLNSLGGVLKEQGKLSEAEETFRKCLDITQNLDDKKHESFILNSLGGVLKEQGKLSEAEEAFRKCLDISHTLDDKKNESFILNSLGGVLKEQGKLNEAEETFRKCLDLMQNLDDKKHESFVLTSLGGVLQKQGKLNEAEETFRRCLDIAHTLDDKKNESFILNRLGGVLQKQGKLKEAEDKFKESLKIVESLDDKTHFPQMYINM